MKNFRSLIALSSASLLLAACAATPATDDAMEGDSTSSAMMEDSMMSSDAMMEDASSSDAMMEGEAKMELN